LISPERLDTATEEIIRWSLSSPVLTRYLRRVIGDGVGRSDDDQELICTVTDLLSPDRGWLWGDMLHAIGISQAEADGLWKRLSEEHPDWMHRVQWDHVSRAVLHTDMF
jgi:hypothetical protein